MSKAKVLDLIFKDKSTGKVKSTGKLEIKNQTDKSSDLYIYGDIVSSTWDKWVDEDTCPQDITDFFNQLEGNENINIYVNSGGGDVFAGLAIYHMIKRNKAHKTVHVDGLAASIASVLIFAADEVIIPATAQFMIHKPWSWTYGNANDLRKFADTLDSVEENLINVYGEHLVEGVDIETIREMVNAETWMTGSEAAKYFNIKVSDQANIAACASGYFKDYKNVPESIKNPKPQKSNEISIAIAKAKLALEC